MAREPLTLLRSRWNYRCDGGAGGVFVGGWFVGVDVGGVCPVPVLPGGGLLGHALTVGSHGEGDGPAPGSALL
ncbi:MAG TPA: hypothetical protein VGO46_03195 [Gemmatimonadaceae bacterium]|jgi:hypothetical protein|nr:hypothetical protein [Gemmatimonadaceae bacterium]